MIKINTLETLEDVSDCYYIDDNYNIININTNKIKTQTIGKRGYKYVTLNTLIENKQKKVFVHKIVALAFIKNDGNYETINHKDGNKLNNSVENLEFCTQRENVIHGWKTGLSKRDEDIFTIYWTDESTTSGTIKQLVEITKIPKQTLYCSYYNKTGSIKWKYSKIFKVTNHESQETIEQPNTAEEL